MIVSKLAAILRVANALDKEHLQKITDLKVTREGDKMGLIAQNTPDLTMERASLSDRSDLFNEIFGKQIILREAIKST